MKPWDWPISTVRNVTVALGARLPNSGLTGYPWLARGPGGLDQRSSVFDALPRCLTISMMFLMSMIVAIAFAAPVHRYVERPCMRLGRRLVRALAQHGADAGGEQAVDHADGRVHRIGAARVGHDEDVPGRIGHARSTLTMSFIRFSHSVGLTPRAAFSRMRYS